MCDKLMKPWTPVVLHEHGDFLSVEVWGRENKSGKSSFLESMSSQGQKILSSPMRVVGTEDGKDFVFDNYNVFAMDNATDAFAETVASAESEQFVLNVAMKTEFDGFIDTSVTVVPRGRTVKQIFGFQDLNPYQYTLSRLWLEIPISKEVAKYYQMFPRSENMSPLEASDRIKEKMQWPFRSQTFIANDEVGLMLSIEGQKNVTPFEKDNFIEILPTEKEVVLRVRLIDEEPYDWRDIDKSDLKERMSLKPLTFRLGILTTPVKPITQGLTSEKALHIDCFKKIDGNYEDFLGSRFENTDEITFDRLKRLGVNTLYLHEKWNDLQNSPILTSATARRLKHIIGECHKRDIKVIPYFGYEISSLSPYFRELLPEVEVTNTRISRWYRQPAQRDSKVCQNSRWSQFFTNGIERLIKTYGFDGVYLDGTAYLWACQNTAHGCGCYSPDGVLHATYPVFGTRKTMKRLYEIVCEEAGGVINCHAGSAFNMPALSFATSMWDGETLQRSFIDGSVTKLPDDYFKCLYTGRNLGLLIYMLCYLNPPNWTFDMALAVSLPFGILPKVNDTGEPLEKISKIWEIYDNFGVDSACFIPFYSKEDKGIEVSDENIKVSVYKKEDSVLAIIALTDKNYESEIEVKSEYRTINCALTGKSLSTNGSAKLKLSGFDFYIIELK